MLITQSQVKKDLKRAIKKDPGHNIKDKFHTLSELYFHRMFLFSIIVNTHKSKCFKSYLHHDDTMFKDMFIVGIEINHKVYSYHYYKQYWNYFNCKAIPNAPQEHHPTEDLGILLKLLR